MSETTLTELLENSGASLRILDMGRRVVKVGRNRFLQFEQTAIPWPAPLVRQAWFGMLMQNNELPEPLIWFLRLPLDEQGKLVLAARDYFIHRLIEAWQLNQQNEGAEITDALKDNPYVFKPRDDRMAVFHAKASVLMKQQPSRFYEHARTYFNGEHGWDQWSFVGYQGIADVAARFDENREALVSAIPALPAEPLIALCHCLENEEIDHAIAEALAKRLDASLNDSVLVTALIRGLSFTKAAAIREKAYRRVLEMPRLASNIEVLAAIAGRAWRMLHESDFCDAYLTALAASDSGQEVFDHCLEDLLFIPEMKKPVRESLDRIGQKDADSGKVVQLFEAKYSGQRNPETSDR
jgi:hypothetical protein